jgi:hypothetical protein
MAVIDIERRSLQVVAWVTLGSGAVQAVAPCLSLDRLARHADPLATHLFATVGMFMTVSGGFLAAALRLPASDRRAPLGWCAAQKMGSAAAVAIGVRHKVLSPVALSVAAFDFVSGALLLDYCRRATG